MSLFKFKKKVKENHLEDNQKVEEYTFKYRTVIERRENIYIASLKTLYLSVEIYKDNVFYTSVCNISFGTYKGEIQSGDDNRGKFAKRLLEMSNEEFNEWVKGEVIEYMKEEERLKDNEEKIEAIIKSLEEKGIGTITIKSVDKE